LGFNKIKDLDYNKTHVERYASKYLDEDIIEKIIIQLDTYYEIETGVFVSNFKLKEILDEIYCSLNINKIAKASDIIKYRNVKNKQKWIKGVSVFGYILL
jgi:hypothetical protein